MHQLRLAFALILTLVTICSPLGAQYGNDWIDYSNEYYKIKVVSDGIYRIPFSAMQDAGMTGATGDNLRLYRLGEEVHIYVSTEGVFGAGDFIEFYGESNKGEFDRTLFLNPDSDLLNPYYSMFSDTSVYFLTTDVGGPAPLRITSIENDLSDLPQAEPYYMHRDLFVFSDEAAEPSQFSSGGTFVSYSSYQHGDGFSSNRSVNRSVRVEADNLYKDGPDTRLKLRLLTDNLVAHDVAVRYLQDTLWRAQISNVRIIDIDTALSSKNTVVSSTLVRCSDLSASGRIRIAYLDWSYPRTPVFQGDSAITYVIGATANKKYFELQGMSDDLGLPLVYDLSGSKRMIADRDGDQLRFALPPSESERNIHVVAGASAIHEIDQLAGVTFEDFRDDNASFAIITHKSLRESALSYRDYRASAAGGGYQAEVYFIEDLYDQFGYGIWSHPQSVRHFARMMRSEWPDARLAFIIGKGLEYRHARQCDSLCQEWFKVPTFGIPGADNLLFAENAEQLPFLSVGRLPAINNDEVMTYLEKAKEHDAVPLLPQTVEDKAWTKHFLHLGGGQTNDQQVDIQNALNNMAKTIADSEYGGEATLFTKNSTNTVGTTNSEEILKILKSGAAVVKFFGHSSGSTLDFQINEADQWDNKGKYPVFSAMGCSAGQIHSIYRSLSESFIFEPSAGAINFIAGSGTQFLDPLALWGRFWYAYMGSSLGDGTTIGETVLESLDAFNSSQQLFYRVLREQQTIAGDPAIRLYQAPAPDLLWEAGTVKFESDIIAITDEEFSFSLDLLNIGRISGDSIDILVEQELPGGEILKIGKYRVEAERFRNNITFTLPVTREAAGVGRIYLTIDPDNLIEELPNPAAEENNTFVATDGRTGIPLYIYDSRTVTIYPEEFSIVTSDAVTLVATSANPLGPSEKYIVQVDTTDAFASDWLQEREFNAPGGVIEWQPEVSFTPGKVYYWRVGLSVTQDSIDAAWDTSSFLYSPGSDEGWNQSHIGQYRKNTFERLSASGANLSFVGDLKNLWVRNEGDFGEGDEPRLFIDNKLQAEFFGWYRNIDGGDVFVVVLDSLEGKLWTNDIEGSYGSVNGISDLMRVFPFSTDSIQGRDSLMYFLEEVIPTGYYVILYTYQRNLRPTYYPELWAPDSITLGRNIFSVIERQYPESNIRALESEARPYIIYYQKDIGVIDEMIASDHLSTINVSHNFPVAGKEGNMQSVVIGPATQWDRYEWQTGIEGQDSASAVISLLGPDLQDTMRYEVAPGDVVRLDTIDTEAYPYALLDYSAYDLASFTAPQLSGWQVYYTGLPDLMIDGRNSVIPDTINSGSTFELSTIIRNISTSGTEPVTARLTVTDQNSVLLDTLIDIPELDAFGSFDLTYADGIGGSEGSYSVFLSVNHDQIMNERTFINNNAVFTFYLLEDKSGPVMDVTFDGRHLHKGDFVAADPLIRIEVQDENSYVALNDSSKIRIFLRHENDADFTEIIASDPSRTFEPASLFENEGINRAVAEYRPMLQPGYYYFRAMATDMNNNQGGDLDYQIQFEVKESRRIGHVDVFPVPARNYISFAFDLSGLNAPDEITLEIYDARGAFLIDLAEQYDLKRIGDHLIYWNTSHLAAGTYFYKISAQRGSEKFNGDNSLQGKFIIAN